MVLVPVASGMFTTSRLTSTDISGYGKHSLISSSNIIFYYRIFHWTVTVLKCVVLLHNVYQDAFCRLCNHRVHAHLAKDGCIPPSGLHPCIWRHG